MQIDLIEKSDPKTKYFYTLANLQDIRLLESREYKEGLKWIVLSSNSLFEYLSEVMGLASGSLEQDVDSVIRLINLYTDMHKRKSVSSSIDYMESFIDNLESSSLHSLPENSFLRVAYYYGVDIVISDPDTFTDVFLKDINNQNKLRLSPRLDDNCINRYLDKKKDLKKSVMYRTFDIQALRYSTKYTEGVTFAQLEC